MALSARNASPWSIARFRDFEPPEHVPRTSARVRTCNLSTRGHPVCPAPKSTRNNQRSEENKMRKCKIVHLVHSNTYLTIHCGQVSTVTISLYRKKCNLYNASFCIYLNANIALSMTLHQVGQMARADS